jgi:elongin-B
MDDEKALQDYGITMLTARAQSPAQLGLAVRIDGDFEPLELTPYSSPPDLPDVMKNQEAANGQEQTT